MNFLVGLKVTAGLQTNTVGAAGQHGACYPDTLTSQSTPVHGELPQGGKTVVRGAGRPSGMGSGRTRNESADNIESPVLHIAALETGMLRRSTMHA